MDAQSVIQSDLSWADKMRALNRAGFERAQIAKLLGKRYQHVRNVLEGDRASERADVKSVPTPDAAAKGDAPVMTPGGFRLTVSPSGDVVIPRAALEALGVGAGDKVLARLDGDAVVLRTPAAALARAQALVRAHVPSGVSLADELIADRRAEVAREDAGG